MTLVVDLVQEEVPELKGVDPVGAVEMAAGVALCPGV